MLLPNPMRRALSDQALTSTTLSTRWVADSAVRGNFVGLVKHWPLFFFRASGAAVPDMPSGLGKVYLAPFRFLVKPVTLAMARFQELKG